MGRSPRSDLGERKTALRSVRVVYVGGQVRVSVRRVWLSFAGDVAALANLRTISLRCWGRGPDGHDHRNRRGSGVPGPQRHSQVPAEHRREPRGTAHPPPRTSVFCVQTAFRPPCEVAPGETVPREPAKRRANAPGEKPG